MCGEMRRGARRPREETVGWYGLQDTGADFVWRRVGVGGKMRREAKRPTEETVGWYGMVWLARGTGAEEKNGLRNEEKRKMRK